MSTLHLVHLHDVAPEPWRNGGGRTRELLAWPRRDAWRLRVSVASIEADGLFSAFAGVQRWFAVLTGAGVRLMLPQGAVALAPRDEPIVFDGEDAPACHLLDGPTLDLNLMVRRGEGQAALRVAATGSGLEGDLPLRACYAADAARIDIEDRTVALAAGTLAWSDERDAAPWVLREGRHAFWLTLEDA